MGLGHNSQRKMIISLLSAPGIGRGGGAAGRTVVATVVGVQVGQGEEVALGAVHRRNLGS